MLIPDKRNQAAARKCLGSRGGRPPARDAEAYKGRNVVERFFALAKQWRGIATRYDKHNLNYRGGVVLHAIIAWRTQHGKFTSIEQMSEVIGISEKFVTEHKAELTIN